MGPKWAILEVPSHLRRAIWHYVISQRYPQGLGGRTGTNHTRAGRGIGVGEDLEPGPSIVPQRGPKWGPKMAQNGSFQGVPIWGPSKIHGYGRLDLRVMGQTTLLGVQNGSFRGPKWGWKTRWKTPILKPAHIQ